MQTTGTLKDVTRDLASGKLIVSFIVDAPTIVLPDDILDITAEMHRKKRSLNANGLLWECLGRIATSIHADKWDVYLMMLKRYGAFTYVCIPPSAVDMLKRQWRECEEIGEININGRQAVQMLCYYGSSTYDTKQFSVLLDGVIGEMKEMGIETPDEEQMRLCIEQMEKQRERNMENNSGLAVI